MFTPALRHFLLLLGLALAVATFAGCRGIPAATAATANWQAKLDSSLRALLDAGERPTDITLAPARPATDASGRVAVQVSLTRAATAADQQALAAAGLDEELLAPNRLQLQGSILPRRLPELAALAVVRWVAAARAPLRK